MLYPTRDLVSDPGPAVMEANHRAALHQIADELKPTDLTALFNLARLLLFVPREPGLFEGIEANTRANLRLWVTQGMELSAKPGLEASLGFAFSSVPK
jgi:hypothetical protein